ncbi:S4 domain-containing protein YaaA [Staphylospora marina]|uniref:S4 domain-containing protein YaaA n=1 Tax=Staphylospora marina TaxID=2490858 RepID=UPI000F5BDB91|nr:S4 domain-containing protein YaaA [Staphylospora marina]
MRLVQIDDTFITLGQLLKKTGIIDTGGQAKHFLAETEVRVNGVPESRRGRKLVPGDVVEIDGCFTARLVQKQRKS